MTAPASGGASPVAWCGVCDAPANGCGCVTLEMSAPRMLTAPEPTPAVERAWLAISPSKRYEALRDVRAALAAALPTECHEAVTDEYDTEEQPCNQPAVAYRRDDEGEPYPVCEEHATDLIPLTVAILGGAR